MKSLLLVSSALILPLLLSGCIVAPYGGGYGYGHGYRGGYGYGYGGYGGYGHGYGNGYGNGDRGYDH